MRFFLMSQGSFDPKIRFLGQKVSFVARSHTGRHTDRVTTEGTLSGFPWDRPNNSSISDTLFEFLYNLALN